MGPVDEAQEDQDDELEASARADEWVLTDEDVQREKEESLARTEAAKAHLKTQEGVTYRINAKLTEKGEYDLLAMAHGMSGAPRHHSPGLQRHGGSNWPAALLEASGSPEQQHSARVVAEEMLRRQERFWKFDQRRKEVLEQDQQLQAQAAKDLEAAELRCAQRQRERLNESRRRAFAAQQRRAEQQKVFRENQREQERTWEAYYTKKERQAKALARASRSPGQPAAAPGRAKSSSAPELDGWQDEEVYKTTLQSHQSYSETIERWRQFEKENERRTEAHKKKLLLSAGFSYVRNTVFDDAEQSKGDKGRIRSLKDGSRGKSGVARRASATSDGLGLAATAPIASSGALAGVEDSLMSGSASLQYSLKSSRSLPCLSLWETRKENCARHQEEQFQQSMQKLQKKQESLQEARQRINVHNKERVEKAGELNQTWKERNDTAAQKRAELAHRSDDDLVHRLDAHAKKRDEETKRQDSQRNELSRAKSERLKEAQTTARSLADKASQKAQEKVNQKDETSQSNVMSKIQEFEERAGKQEYDEMAREIYERKVSQNEEFRKKAAQEMEMKEARSQNVLLQKKQSPIEKCRAQRKEKSSPSRAATQRLSAQLTPLSDPEAPATERQEEPPEGRSSGSFLPALPGAGKRSTGGRGSWRQSVRELGLQGGETAGRASLAAVLASELQEQGEAEAEGARDQHRHSVLSGVDSDDEGVFLKELEARGVKWLHELRKEKERSSWKP